MLCLLVWSCADFSFFVLLTTRIGDSSQSAYPHKTNSQLDEFSADLTSVISSALSSSITPSSQLTIVPNKKCWLLNVDALVLSDAGNIFDALFIAIRGALWDLKIPRTHGIQFDSQPPGKSGGEGDIMKDVLRERRRADAIDFELEDYWDDGDPLANRDSLPIAITLNLVSNVTFSNIYGPHRDSLLRCSISSILYIFWTRV